MEETLTQPFQFVDCSPVTVKEENQSVSSEVDSSDVVSGVNRSEYINLSETTIKKEMCTSPELDDETSVDCNKKRTSSLVESGSLGMDSDNLLCPQTIKSEIPTFLKLKEEKDIFDVHQVPEICCRTKKNVGLPATLKKNISNCQASYLINEPQQSIDVFSCDTSENSCRVRKTLHQNTGHVKLKFYACETCKKSFADKRSLIEHQNSIHLGIKPFACETCQKSFVSKRCLIRHQNRVHNGLEPYTCEFCKKFFEDKHGLMDHQNSIHFGFRGITCNT